MLAVAAVPVPVVVVVVVAAVEGVGGGIASQLALGLARPLARAGLSAGMITRAEKEVEQERGRRRRQRRHKEVLGLLRWKASLAGVWGRLAAMGRAMTRTTGDTRGRSPFPQGEPTAPLSPSSLGMDFSENKCMVTLLRKKWLLAGYFFVRLRHGRNDDDGS